MGSRARFASLLSASILLLLLLSAEPLGLRQQTPHAGGELLGVAGRYLTREERWMNQRLDHFSPTVRRFLYLTSSGLVRSVFFVRF
jgi:hypothetical protein